MKIGIDIGGTSTKFGYFDTHGKLIEEKIIDTPTKYVDALGKICQVISANNHVSFVGVSMSGIIDHLRGQIILSNRFPDWSKKYLSQDLESQIHIPVKIHNDAVCAALAEVGGYQEKFVYIVWGTGVGGAVVDFYNSNIRVYPIEPGSQIVNNTPLSYQIGGHAFRDIYHVKLALLSENNLIWDKLSQVMAQAIINILTCHPCRQIIFGGGLINKQQHLLAKIRKQIEHLPTIFDTPKLIISKYGEKNGIHGAAMLSSIKLV